MSNFQIHELTSGTIDRDSNVIHDTLNGGNYETRKATAGAVADLANVNVAAPYDSTVTYAIGQYCLYEGDIYRCIAITTGAFDSTAWTQIVVTGEFRRVVELTSAQYTALSSAEKNNGTLYVITDEETTADDIPYSQGVSVADKIDATNIALSAIPNLNNIAWQMATRNDAGGFTGGQCRYIKCGKLVLGVIEDLIGVNSTHNTVVFSNLPVPESGMIGLIQLTGAAFKAPFRIRISGGNIVNWYSSINNVQGSEGYMFFAYVSQ